MTGDRGSTLEGRVAVVTAAASGIGWGIARHFAAHGARVVLGDIRGDAVAERAAELGGDALAVRADVTVEEDVETLMDAALDRFGALDIAVNCAGTNVPSAIVDADASAWRTVVDVCLTGTMLGTKHAARRITAPGGAILNIASLNATQPAEGMSAYCAAKAGVTMLTQVSAMELGPRGVRVNAIAPGLVETPLVAALLQPGIHEEYVENTPLGRHGQPADIARAALFLVSEAASWISGDVLYVDGAAHTKRCPGLLRHLERQASQQS